MAQSDIDAEYRAALVFYGGVSLAVYENGVARAFFDACRQRGLFAPLMQLLAGRFVVDVVSGSSAGGINGLLLATALEGGAEFSQTAKLWREAGGLDNLLRPVSQADTAKSLLRGETYYVEQLRQAFRQLCQSGHPGHGSRADADAQAAQAEGPPSGPVSVRRPGDCPKEIDVYVTGTSLTGQVEPFVDAVGSTIETKNHRLVFHLKHRNERAWLGLVADEGLSMEQRKLLQADVLASVARITSSFPGAFPPFTVEELAPLSSDRHSLPDTRGRVRQALEHLAGVKLTIDAAAASNDERPRDNALIDGGVLDNKPFGPVLDAIFHRLPSERGLRVERTLFYIEPDPVRFKQRAEFTPLEVIINALITLPMYDSIARDLRRLDEHNARIRRFQMLREQASRAIAGARSRPASEQSRFLYRATLRQSIGCMLLGVDPGEVDSAKHLEKVVRSMAGRFPEASPSEAADAPARLLERDLDIAFHMRRAYYVLYARNSGGEPLVQGRARHHVGRVIKALKLLRDVWLAQVKVSERGSGANALPGLGVASTQDETRLAARRLSVLRGYLAADWLDGEPLSDADDPANQLSSARLNQFRAKAVAWLRQRLPRVDSAIEQENEGDFKAQPRALDWLSDILGRCVSASDRPQLLAEFDQIDEAVYPAEFAAELYELDQLQVVRVSPKDAKLSDVQLTGKDKITGDELGHFSAFLRKDWRTNDIAWGHADGMRQIVHALLPASECERVGRAVVARRPELEKAFSTQGLMAAFDSSLAQVQRDKIRDARLTAAKIAGLEEACQRVAERFDDFADWAARGEFGGDEGAGLFKELRNALVAAGAIAAMGEYTEQIVRDTEAQNRTWRWPSGPSRTRDNEVDASKQVAGMKLGSRPIAEELPPSLTVQYGGHAGLLLWGMFDRSLGPQSAARRITERLSKAIKPVLWSAYYLGKLIRMEKLFASALLLSLGLAGIAFGLGAAFAGSVWLTLAGVAATLWVAWLTHQLAQHTIRTLVVAALGLTVLTGGFFWFHLQGPELRQGAGKVLLAAAAWVEPSIQGDDVARSERKKKGRKKKPGTAARKRRDAPVRFERAGIVQ